jgi:chemotaxis signal transduction protein
MNTLSPLQSRRFHRQTKQKTLQFITFRLHQEWFALSLNQVNKVILLEQIYGDPKATGISLTLYQNKELVVIDVGYKIFGDSPDYQKIIDKFNQTDQPYYLIILENDQKEKIGLPIDSPPQIKRVSENLIKPLPNIYLQRENIKCLSSNIIELTDQSPSHFFILDKNKLFLN